MLLFMERKSAPKGEPGGPAEMKNFAGELARDPPRARIEPRGGKALVTDGPFAEAKETVGGYGLVRVASRAEAIDLAKRYPHAKWGPVEVREIMFFDPT